MALVSAAAAGCGSSPSLAVRIQVSPASGRYDTALDIAVTGLPVDHAVTLQATTTGVLGNTYRSTATFTSDARGDVDLSASSPTSGSYTGVQAQGLLWSMACVGCSFVLHPPAGGYHVAVTATVDGSVVATAHLVRRVSDTGVTETDERPSVAGFYGDYFRPASTAVPRPAVLLFGGSEGGLNLDPEASLLASDGYPALALAYFDEPGLPSTLSYIPLEYFATALQWLSRQAGVDPAHMVVQGASRGSEAALLLGVDFPSLVRGVIALSPNDAVLCNVHCTGPVWTLHGDPLLFTSQFNTPMPSDVPAAVIPVERVHGPILLDCGVRDQIWNSCAFASALQARLTGFRFAHTLLRYPDAGHDVSYPPPEFPAGCCQPDDLARIDQWPHVLAFLGAI